jgi:hypothetical protein
MLTKCANPACSTPFRRLNDGKLFHVETEYAGNEDNGKGRNRVRQIEYYWLCSECASFVTLAADPGSGIMTVPLPNGEFKEVRLVNLLGENRPVPRPGQEQTAANLGNLQRRWG